MSKARALVLLGFLIAAIVAILYPEDLRATRTVGHQARSLRHRVIDEDPEPRGPRLCNEGETSKDREPCIEAMEASSRLPFGR